MGSTSRRALSVDRFADKIKDSVHNNTVTLIIGQTGCGKSSRVPQMLQEELGGPVMCTQPRRLAVVAIASHVAELVGCDLGQDVGFKIGQKSVASRRTCMVFTTSGLLLEELRANGAAALRPYKCLIIDELHERSVESDLLLACLHAMVAAGELPTLKLVLMSATANVERYQSYFKLPGDHVALIRLDMQRLTTAIGEWLETVKVMYLDQVLDKVLQDHPNRTQHESQRMQHHLGEMTPLKQVAHPMSLLIRDLVLHLHATEPDPDAVILVFLPTYRALLLQHKLLLEAAVARTIPGVADAHEEGPGDACEDSTPDMATTVAGGQQVLDVFALHSSVDIDEALEAIQGPRMSGRRRVVLATNCAESSITLPNVKHVVDSCTTNQVYWDPTACREYARVIWASQSAAQQRAGRTGRTCSGTCYRLMTRLAFNALPKYEASALTLRSLRREVLCLLSSSSKVMADPCALLGQALDPPDDTVVEDALEYLQQIGAAKPNHKGKVEPTQTGNLLAALPISLESSLLLVQGGLQGLTREAAVLAALINTTPFPILQPFGADAMRHVKQYSSSGGNGSYSGSNGSYSGSNGHVSGHSSAVDCTVEVVDEDSAGFGKPGLTSKLGASRIKQQTLSSSSSRGSNTSGVSTLASTAATVSPSDDAPGGVSRAQLLLANMAAYFAWQQQWCDTQRLAALQSDPQSDQQQQQVTGKQTAEEGEWCRQHYLLPASLRAVNDLLGIIYGVLHKYRPCVVHDATGPPAYFEQKSAHRCRLQSSKLGQQCWCGGLNTTTLLAPQACRKLQALLHEVACAGTAHADTRLLQSRIHSIHQHSTSSASTSTSSSCVNRVGHDDRSGPVCKYFLAGLCDKGSRCAFRHSRPTCKFYLSRTGCIYGVSCRFLHGSDTAAAASSSNSSEDGSQQQQQGEGGLGLWFDWLPDSVSSSSSSRKGAKATSKAATANTAAVAVTEAYREELLSSPSSSGSGIVLLGEGDLSFVSALVSARQAAGLSCSNITATVLEEDVNQLLALYPRTQVSARLLSLMAADVSVQYGINATQLLSTAAHIQWAAVGHLVWNFPLATSAEATGVPTPASTLLGESDEANKQLMGRFLMSAARLLLCFNPHIKVHIALCNDQYGRWGMEQLTRSCFMFLEASKALDLRTWPGYTPKRGQLDNAFPADRLVVYTFGLALPQACSELGVRSRLMGLHLKQLQQGLCSATVAGAGFGVGVDRQQENGEEMSGERGFAGIESAEEGLGDMGFNVFPGTAVAAGF